MGDYFDQGVDSAREQALRDKKTIREKRLREPRCTFWFTDPLRRRWGFTTRKRRDDFVSREKWKEAGLSPGQRAVLEKRRERAGKKASPGTPRKKNISKI